MSEYKRDKHREEANRIWEEVLSATRNSMDSLLSHDLTREAYHKEMKENLRHYLKQVNP